MIPQTNNSYIFKIASTFYFGFPKGIVKNKLFRFKFLCEQRVAHEYGLNGHGLHNTRIMQYA